MRIKIGILLIICYTTIGCDRINNSLSTNSQSTRQTLPELKKASDQLPDKLSQDPNVVEYLSDYEETLEEFYREALIDRLNQRLIRGLWHTIKNAWPLLSLEQKRNAFKSNYSDEKWMLIRLEEDKITKIINYAYYILNSDKIWNTNRYNIGMISPRCSEYDESLDDHLDLLEEYSVSFDILGAEFRYRFMNQYVYNPTPMNISDFIDDFKRVQNGDYKVSDMYDRGTIEKKYLSALNDYRTELENKEYTYFNLKEDWSISKQQAYDSVFVAFNGIIDAHIHFLELNPSEVEPVNFFELQKGNKKKKSKKHK